MQVFPVRFQMDAESEKACMRSLWNRTTALLPDNLIIEEMPKPVNDMTINLTNRHKTAFSSLRTGD